jgi:hypothetical protein
MLHIIEFKFFWASGLHIHEDDLGGSYMSLDSRSWVLYRMVCEARGSGVACDSLVLCLEILRYMGLVSLITERCRNLIDLVSYLDAPMQFAFFF